MLKWLAAAAIAANGLFFGYTQGWFDGLFGLDSTGDREPERLQAQVRPESVLLLPLPASGPAAARAPRCLEAGPFTAGDLASAEAALRVALPEGGWRVVAAVPTGDPSATSAIRVDAADPDLGLRLAELRLGAAGKAFLACP